MNEISLSDHTALTHRPTDHPKMSAGAIGVLLVNLGTPEAADAGSVRRYLREFLSDKRVHAPIALIKRSKEQPS